MNLKPTAMLILALFSVVGVGASLTAHSAPSIPSTQEEPEAATDGLLHVEIQSAGESHLVTLEVVDATGESLLHESVVLPENAVFVRDVAVAPEVYTATISSVALVPETTPSYEASSSADVAKCGSVEATIRFIATVRVHGLAENRVEVPPSTCADGSDASPWDEEGSSGHLVMEGTYMHRVAVSTPLAPHARSLMPGGCLGFSTGSHVGRVEIVATWAAVGPASQRMRFDVYAGEGTTSLAHAEGETGISLSLVEPAPGDYCILPWAAGPVGVAVEQPVTFRVLVSPT